MTRFLSAPFLALALLAGCGGTDTGTDNAAGQTGAIAGAVAPPAGTTWADTVAMTPEGGVRMGNPDAAVKLVEWGSFTCPHCADFSATASQQLRDRYIASGKVSWEFRPFLLNGIDVPVTLLARCGGPEPFFKLAEQVYAGQREWVGRLQSATPEQQKALEALPPERQFAEIARLAGLDRFFAVRGLPAAKQQLCLGDKAAADRLVAMRNDATEKEGITGTPGFLINGEIQPNVADWSALQPRLDAAIG